MATSHWDTIDPKVGESREDELKTDFWLETLKAGAHYERIQTNSRRDVGHLIEYILAKQFETVVIRTQQELVEEDKRVAQTDAGKTLSNALRKRLGEPAPPDPPDTTLSRPNDLVVEDRFFNDPRPDDLIIVSVISILFHPTALTCLKRYGTDWVGKEHGRVFFFFTSSHRLLTAMSRSLSTDFVVKSI